MSTFSQKVKLWKRSENKILTPRVLEWLNDHGSFTVPEDKLPVLNALVTDDSNSVRHGRFGASSRGDCRRMQVFKYLGVPGIGASDPILSNIFLDGTWRHIRWQMLGLTNGWFTEVEVKAAVPELRLGVSADALNRDEGWGFELKGTSMLDSVIRNGVPEKHLLQVHTMMYAFDMDRWVYMAEDKSRQEIHEVVIERDDKLMQAVTEELNDLNEHVNARGLPPVLPACRGGDGRTYERCAFRGVCLDFDCSAVPDGGWDEPTPVAIRTR